MSEEVKEEILPPGSAEHAAAWERLRDEIISAIVENERAILEIADAGGVAALVDRPHPRTLAFARALGWDKYGPSVVALSADDQRRIATADSVTARWLSRCTPGTARIFYISAGTLLLNYEAESKRLWIEPGSLDTELAATRS